MLNFQISSLGKAAFNDIELSGKLLNILIGSEFTKKSFVSRGTKEMHSVRIKKRIINIGITKNIVSNPKIIWTEINIPIHEFLEFVNIIETRNNKHIIVVITFLDIFLFEIKQ